MPKKIPEKRAYGERHTKYVAFAATEALYDQILLMKKRGETMSACLRRILTEVAQKEAFLRGT